jgi:DNA polymerase-3 subunit epsilon
LSKKVWPAYKSHSLSNLAKTFDIVYNAHNALADAETCGKIITLCAKEVVAASKRKSGKSVRMPLSKLLEDVNVKVKSLS